MVKGISRRVVVVDSPDQRFFEQAIFIVRNDAAGEGVTARELVEEARRVLHALARENYAVIYLTEQAAAQMEADVNRYKDELTPAIILIPGKEGSLGIGMANVKSAVERAVGADIL